MRSAMRRFFTSLGCGSNAVELLENQQMVRDALSFSRYPIFLNCIFQIKNNTKGRWILQVAE